MHNKTTPDDCSECSRTPPSPPSAPLDHEAARRDARYWRDFDGMESELIRAGCAGNLARCHLDVLEAAREASQLWRHKGGKMLPDQAWADDDTVHVEWSGRDFKRLSAFLARLDAAGVK